MHNTSHWQTLQLTRFNKLSKPIGPDKHLNKQCNESYLTQLFIVHPIWILCNRCLVTLDSVNPFGRRIIQNGFTEAVNNPQGVK